MRVSLSIPIEKATKDNLHIYEVLSNSAGIIVPLAGPFSDQGVGAPLNGVQGYAGLYLVFQTITLESW
jgi:hypothetical protein